MIKNRFFQRLGQEGFHAWEDLRFPATGINPPGAVSDPSRDTSDGTLIFAAAATNLIAGVAQLPHAWKQGSDISPHIHLEVTNTNTGNMVWKFEYNIASINGSFAESYSSETITVANDGTVRKHVIIPFTDIDMSSYNISCIVKWKISRLGDNAADTYSSTSKFLEFDIHYEIDSLGSPAEFTK